MILANCSSTFCPGCSGTATCVRGILRIRGWASSPTHTLASAHCPQPAVGACTAIVTNCSSTFCTRPISLMVSIMPHLFLDKTFSKPCTSFKWPQPNNQKFNKFNNFPPKPHLYLKRIFSQCLVNYFTIFPKIRNLKKRPVFFSAQTIIHLSAKRERYCAKYAQIFSIFISFKKISKN